MSTYKTQINQAQVEQFLQKYLRMPKVSIEIMADGEVSEAFSFEDKDGSHVIRISKHGTRGFLKDSFAHTHFASGDLPIPTILDIGEFGDGLHYTISTKAPGQTLDKFSSDEIETLIPKIFHVLGTIHALSPAREGYGLWDEHGNGWCGSWREEQIASLHQDDKETRAASFYNTELHNKLRNKITQLLDFCPNERQLVHGDFGFSNVVSDGKDITGVLDWEMSMYGDPLYDVAWLDFWDTKHNYHNIFKKYYEKQGDLPSNYDKRVLAYKLQIGLSSLGFFARSRQADKYVFAKRVIAGVVS
jgi:hygromycin-B 4-O-kinase